MLNQHAASAFRLTNSTVCFVSLVLRLLHYSDIHAKRDRIVEGTSDCRNSLTLGPAYKIFNSHARRDGRSAKA